MKKVNCIIGIFLLCAISFVNAQRDFTMYNLRHVPQSLSTNPSFKPAYNNYISLPVLSGLSLDIINTGFSISDILVPNKNGTSDDGVRDSLSLYFNTENAFFDQMKGSNRIAINLALSVIGFGFKVKNNFIFFDVKNKLNAEVGYSSDFLKLMIQGNVGSLLGSTADLSGLGLNITNYNEYGLGINRDFSDKLRIGAKFKLLSGVFNINTLENNLSMKTNIENFGLNFAGGFKIGTSNIAQFTDSTNGNPQDLVGNLFNFKNFGLGLDLGATYDISEKFSLNASLIDLGFIRWSDNVQTHTLKQFDFTFNGLESKSLFNNDSIQENLVNIFETTKDNKNYSTWLDSRFYLGANYKFSSILNLGATWYNEINHGKYRPGISVSATFSSKKRFSTTFNYSYFSGASNIGFGLNFRGFYIVTDNLLALPMFNLYGSRIASISIGANIVFGKDKEKQTEIKD